MKISFKLKTALLITLIITFVCSLCVFSIVAAGKKTASNELQQKLVKSVERNVDEIEVKNGILDIERDFAYFNNGVYCSVYSPKGEYLGGELPSTISTNKEFVNGEISKQEINGEHFWVYDSFVPFNKYECEIDIDTGNIINCNQGSASFDSIKESEYRNTKFQTGINAEEAIGIALDYIGVQRENVKIISVEFKKVSSMRVFEIEFVSKDADGIWIRGTVDADVSENTFGTINQLIIYSFPFFIFIAAALAYLIASKTIKPIEDISSAAQKISSGHDLSERIEIGSGTDEIHTLAETFNGMLERLSQSFENEKQFTSDASHELRTPLAVIKGECEYALSGNADESEFPEAFREIQLQTDKMASLVSTLLTLTRAEQKSCKFKLEPNDISALCEEVCKNFKSDKGIKIDYDIEKDIVMNCEPVLICRLLENLLSNSVKYGKPNGNTFVKLFENEKNIVLSVKDNGIGMNEDDRQKAFNRFFRANSARSDEGFGLGLSLVSKIAELHNGKASVKSEENIGSEFIIAFDKP